MQKSKVLGSLWVLLLVLLIGTASAGISSEIYRYFYGNTSFVNAIMVGAFGSVFSFFTYGLLFWPPVLLFYFILELVLTKKIVEPTDLKMVFVIETGAVSVLFTYLAISHSYPVWYYFIILLILGDCLRFWKLKVTIR